MYISVFIFAHICVCVCPGNGFIGWHIQRGDDEGPADDTAHSHDASLMQPFLIFTKIGLALKKCRDFGN